MTRRRGVHAAVALGLCAAAACAPRHVPATDPGAAATRPAGGARASTLSAADTALATAFEARFAAADATALWAVRLERLDTSDPVVLVSRNADRLMIPASNMKIATLAAAATRLGWDHRFRTEIVATGSRDGHVVRGDLIVVGGADPTIGRGDDPLATFRDWARRLRAAGIRRVDGDLVGDPSRFGEAWLGDSWSWDDLPAGYAAAYSGLIFNENVVRISVAPGPHAGAPVIVAASPVAYGLHLAPAAVTSDAGEASTIRVTRGLGSSIIEITGSLPVGAAPIDRTVSVSDPPRYFLGALRAMLAEEGIEIRGATRVEATQPLAVTPLLVHESAPLADVARRFMKVSQNLYGEVLLHALATSPASPGSSPKQALEEALAALGVPAGGAQGLDGSGLSRRDFLTARTVTTLLDAMAVPPHREPFRATLPIAGRDGTLATRFAGSPCVDRLIAKTGTLAHVRSLSGYITSATGTEYAFAVLANNYIAPTADIDRIAEDALALVCAS